MKSKFYDKYLIHIIAIIFPIIGILSSLRYSFPRGTDTYFHYLFSQQIIENNFLLPKTIPYFWDGVMAGYPPLTHYILAVISFITTIDLLTVYKIAPWLFLCPLIYSIHFFIKQFDKEYALLGTTIFLLIPIYLHVFYVGEFARIPGLIFALFSLGYLKRYLVKSKKRTLIYSGIFYGLTIFSHIYATAIVTVVLLYWVIEQKLVNKKDSPILALVIGLIIASPWLIFVIKNFGFFYLFNVFTSHSGNVVSFVPYIAIALLFLPLIKGIYKKKFHSTILIFFILSLISRAFIMVPISYYFSKGLHLLIKNKNRVKKLTMSFIVISIILFTVILTSSYSEPYMTEEKFEAITWIKENTEEESKFLFFDTVLYTEFDNKQTIFDQFIGYTNRKIMAFDTVIPGLTKRETYSWFAFEWNLSPERLGIIHDLRETLCKTDILNKIELYELNSDYVWVTKQEGEFRETYCNDLTEPEFTLVFSNSEVDIYKFNA